MFNNLNNINKNARKYSAPNNYPNFKTITFNNPSSNTKGNETFQLGINPENFQNSFGRNAFFQSFWKAYSKSYDYDYYPTSSDVNKTASDFYREISSIFDENSKNRELVISFFKITSSYYYFCRISD